ncbi:pirin family protein [Candidatus Berkiella aquae]|uniref:Pirin family protein n=1 Tax=Candidatus Berkiella aquae TaxID=295108 RepID=A0A0Q9YWZ6_9GAMM|nr:pirin family protein [Candidatus Berkiella aquae]MCS5711021.1 pirin family protein [Candidatus Berkiella aquae]
MSEQTIVRAIKKVWKSQPTIEGAGVHLKRVFGFQELPLLDPFLLLDDFRSENPRDYKAGFPWHPHRGIETITYVLDGDVEHGDSLGNRGMISAGDIQWMTAGSGIIHQEMPQGNRKGEMLGFQLWANLPAKSKMMAPRYQEIKRNDIPVLTTPDGIKIRIVCGTVDSISGPVKDVMSEPEFLDVEIPAGKAFTHSIDASHTVFAYVIDGRGYFDPKRSPFSHEAYGDNYFDMEPPCACENGTLVLYGPGAKVNIITDTESVRFLLISGKPLQEPIAWYGPIVMNSQEELKNAFQELQAGTFIKGE